MGGGFVDEVPPGAADDEFFVKAKRLEGVVLAVRAKPRDAQRGVALFAVLCWTIQCEHGIPPNRKRERLACPAGRLGQLANEGYGHAEKGHARLHISLPLERAFRIGQERELFPKLTDQTAIGR